MLFYKSLNRFLREFLDFKQLLRLSQLLRFPILNPLMATVSVTQKCNSKCCYCDIWRFQEHIYDPTTEELDKILFSLRELGIKAISISGGEPLMRKDIEGIISQVKDYHMRAQVVTNGILLSKDKSRELVQAGIDSIVLSLDTFNPNIYEKLRGTSFKFAKQALESLLYAQEQNSQLDIVISCVINGYNISELALFTQKVTEFSQGKVLINFQPYQKVPGRINDDLIPNSEKHHVITKEIERLIEMKNKGFPITNSVVFLSWIPDFLIYNEMPKGFKCAAGYTGIYIWSDLTMHPCHQLPMIADLRKDTLENIWFSRRFNEQRAKMENGKCRGCLLFCHSEQTLYEWANKEKWGDNT
ncbi:radical SAM protein [Dehalococcoidia bacterium]|nr:radical SAM protein [Dehalococcoidia bacterium]